MRKNSDAVPTVEYVREKLHEYMDYEASVDGWTWAPDEEGVVGRYVCLWDDIFTVADLLCLLNEIDRLRKQP